MTPEEFKKHYLPLQRRLYALAIKSLGDRSEAEDAVQTFYLKLWEKHQQLNNVENHWNYSAKALLNICRDRWHDINRQTAEEIDEEIPDVQTGNYELTDFENFVKFYIEKLPHKQKLVIQMRMQGATTEDIADLTGFSPTNIRTILSRVRKDLKKHYNS